MKVLIAELVNQWSDSSIGLLVNEQFALAEADVDSVTGVRQTINWLSTRTDIDLPTVVIVNFTDVNDGLVICQSVRQRLVPHVFLLFLCRTTIGSNWKSQLLIAGADVCLNLDELGQLAAHLEALKRIADSQSRLLADRKLLQFQSAHDPLLGNLLNYSAILARLELQVKSADQKPVSLMMADIDNFSQVNNLYGHLAGNTVLKQVAERIRSSVRANDAVGRFGGEEFLVVLSNCPAKETTKLAERIRCNVSREPVDLDSAVISVNVSIGVTTILEKMSAENGIKQADLALYQAKRFGKNQVRVYDGKESSNSGYTGRNEG